jgi:hypothetical protein
MVKDEELGEAEVKDEEQGIIYLHKIRRNELIIYYNDSENKLSSFGICTYAPIKFDYCKIRTNMRFGTDSNPLDLTNFSFSGCNLSNVEFHNVKWLKETKRIEPRNYVINEKLENPDYKAIARIYNQLRKNLESELRFGEASDFFIGEMESIRKSLKSGSLSDKIKSLGYLTYYVLAKYGESVAVPLIIWTPSIITIFFLLRAYASFLFGVENQSEDMVQSMFDSLAAFFNFPARMTYLFNQILI